MDAKLLDFQRLESLFKKNGFSLYLVGGTVRDYLLGLPLEDMDAVTDATPENMKVFLPDANYAFEKFGSISYKNDKKVKFDITTLREENGYLDARHPDKIHFVKDLRIDVKRRDFTINALYLDSDLNVIDFVNGQTDLQNKTLKMVGDPNERLKEDPLRIIRAFRFAADYDLVIDKELSLGIRNNIQEIDRLNVEKIKMDLKKCLPNTKEKILSYFEEYNIKHLKDVIE